MVREKCKKRREGFICRYLCCTVWRVWWWGRRAPQFSFSSLSILSAIILFYTTFLSGSQTTVWPSLCSVIKRVTWMVIYCKAWCLIFYQSACFACNDMQEVCLREKSERHTKGLGGYWLVQTSTLCAFLLDSCHDGCEVTDGWDREPSGDQPFPTSGGARVMWHKD